MTQYQVIAPCVTHIPVPGPGGTSLDTLYAGAVLPEGVPQDRIEYLLEAGLIAQVGKQADAATVNQLVPGQPAEPAGDKTVNSRSSKGELVDYGVSRGGNREELEGLTRDQLIERYVRGDQQ